MLDEYIADPTKYRQELAEYLGIAHCNAKQVFNGLFFDGKVPPIGQLYNAPVRFKITDYAGGNKNVVKLHDNQRFMRLYNEVRTMPTILRHHREIDSERITNSFGKALSLNRTTGVKAEKGQVKSWRSRSTILHHLFVGYERQFLEIARQFCDVQCMLHDGFVVREQIDVIALEQVVYERTRLKIKYDSRVLQS